MALLEGLATLDPDIHTREFWDACTKRELRFQKCRGCGVWRFPPLTGCRQCGSTDATWEPVSGRGRVFSYTVVHHPAVPDVAEHVPYAIVVVEFDDAPGARVISNVLGVPYDQVSVGMELEVEWDEPRPGVVLPRFKPA